jgi:hypothetical protein
VLFENTPTAFNWVVFAVIGRIIRQTSVDVIVLYKFSQTLHKLSPPTVVFWSIIQIDDQRRDLGKTLSPTNRSNDPPDNHW